MVLVILIGALVAGKIDEQNSCDDLNADSCVVDMSKFGLFNSFDSNSTKFTPNLDINSTQSSDECFSGGEICKVK